MNKDLQINYELLQESIEQSIKIKEEQKNHLESEIVALYEQYEHLESLKNTPVKSSNTSSERKFRWSDLVIYALESKDIPLTTDQIIKTIIESDQGSQISQDYKRATYRHRIRTAIKNHTGKKKILAFSNDKGDVIYLLPNWIDNSFLKKSQFTKFKLSSSISLEDFGIENDSYLDEDGEIIEHGKELRQRNVFYGKPAKRRYGNTENIKDEDII